MYEFFVATIPRLGRCFLFLLSLLEGSILVCHLLTTYLCSFRLFGNTAHGGTKGVLTREASQAAKLIFLLGLGIEMHRKRTLSMG